MSIIVLDVYSPTMSPIDVEAANQALATDQHGCDAQASPA
jgi:hypothetical protein